MRPLSDALPKPALPLPQLPVVASALRLAVASGAARLVVNTWHLADEMAAAVDRVELPIGVEISRETSLMGTAGGLALARDRGLLGDRGPVLVVNGDGLLRLDLEPLLEAAAAGSHAVTLALLPHLDPRRWSRVGLDSDGTVARIESPGEPRPGEVPLLYPGVMVVGRDALDAIPPGPGEIPDRLWQPARERGGLGGVVVAGHWREIGTPIDYLDTVLARLDGGLHVDPTADVHPSARLAAAAIGRESRVDADAVVNQAIVIEGAVVGRGARLTRSVIAGGARVDPDEVVTGEFRGARRGGAAARAG